MSKLFKMFAKPSPPLSEQAQKQIDRWLKQTSANAPMPNWGDLQRRIAKSQASDRAAPWLRPALVTAGVGAMVAVVIAAKQDRIQVIADGEVVEQLELLENLPMLQELDQPALLALADLAEL